MERLLEVVAKALSDALARFRYRSRIEIAAEALRYEDLKGGSRALVEEELRFMLVRQVTDLAANDAKRERVFELIQKSKGELGVGLFARAKHRLQMRDDELIAVVEVSDSRNRSIALALCAVIFVAGACLLAAPALLHAAGVTPGLGLLAAAMLQGVALEAFAIFLVVQVDHLRAAAELAPILMRLQRADA